VFTALERNVFSLLAKVYEEKWKQNEGSLADHRYKQKHSQKAAELRFYIPFDTNRLIANRSFWRRVFAGNRLHLY